MICKECIKYKLHKGECWFYWDDKMACSRFEDGMGERFKDSKLDLDAFIQKHVENK